ncbi:MAG: deaminase [bacterium]|nr:deaminase [bacterium]
MSKIAAHSVIVAYVPVLHRGYLQFFEADPKVNELYIIGSDLLKTVDYIRKDLRALSPEKIAEIIEPTGLFASVYVLSPKNIAELDSPGTQILMPDEDISRAVGEMFKRAKTTYFPVFLRWDRRSLEKTDVKDPAVVVSNKKNDKDRMKQAFAVAGSSSDIWRRVGALLLDKNDKEVGLTTNQGGPSSHSPWMEGDPRNIFNQGVGIEMSLFMHAEAALIAKAAKDGTKLEGGSMYVTTFPCPLCAKLIAHSGIQNLYYSQGYGMLDGKRVLEDHGVKLRMVPINQKKIKDDPNVWVPYKKS